MSNTKIKQLEICRRYYVSPCPIEVGHKIGISLNVKDCLYPINGMRIPPEGDTSGWYIWAGNECSIKSDFFQPLHVEHLTTWSPNVIKFLQLPQGWRFLYAPDYEDVWYDEKLLSSRVAGGPSQ